MKMLRLVLPSPEYTESVKNAVEEYKAHPSPFDIHAIRKLIEFADSNFEGYFEYVENQRTGINLIPGHVPSTSLWLVEDGNYIGSFDIRHELTPQLEKSGAHIGYQIIPSQRRKGFVKAGLKLALSYAREVLKLERALLTCEEENIGSYLAMTSVMREYGGEETEPAVTDGHKERRVWIETVPYKKKSACI